MLQAEAKISIFGKFDEGYEGLGGKVVRGEEGVWVGERIVDV